MHSPSGTRPKKRLACDRCHARKLRCSSDLDGCTRCLGDDLVCTYSPALKVGRPSKASMAGREILQQTQSVSDAAFYGISDGDAVTADSGISMPPSPPQLGDSCIADHTALFSSFDFANTLDTFNATHPFLDMPMGEDLWPLATSPPVSSNDPNIDPRLCPTNETTNASSPLDRLSSLQQELLRTKLPPAHARGVGTKPRPAKYTEAAMRPIQETLGAVTELLQQCVKDTTRDPQRGIVIYIVSGLHAVRLAGVPRCRPGDRSAVEIDLAGDCGGLPIETSVPHSEDVSVQVHAFGESGNSGLHVVVDYGGGSVYHSVAAGGDKKYIAAIARIIDEIPSKLDDPSLLHEESLLNGQWVQAQSGKRFDVEDPGSGQVWATSPTNEVADVDKYVESSEAAFQSYRHMNPRQRAKILLKWHEFITNARQDIAKIVVFETGKPMAEALGEVDYALGFAWWFAGEAERIRGSVAQPSISNRRTFVIKQPIGVCVALVPWNFPVAMIIRKVSAALAAGCTMIVKPSPETPFSVMALADLALRAGLPAGVLNVISTDNSNTPSVSETLCKHPLVRKVTFTGSTSVGSIVARHCSEGLKKVTMELGGNCPFIIFDDGDLEQAVAALMILKWRTAGQACTHANRVYVQSGVYDKFAQMMLEATNKLRVGHGADSGSTMGPLTTSRGVDKVKKHVEDAVSKGGKVLCGGKQPENLKGYFFEPTIISGMTADMLTTQEEIFGPILGLYKFETEDEVVKKANDTSMGLASYFFTKDVSRTWRLLEILEAGMIGMNTGNASCAESPFGGIKLSGYGKEAGKDVAIEEYLIQKTGTLTVDDGPKL
ncbi:succinate-semialdehyde dehydrogenase [Fusarium tjaetaba]|uniref:Succinate-semialdehyde dehydrogenase n=1 Tax=Fusarium tjaetaba TaxID=1567544 RepID=A0A8H5VKA6_9HYPO|nr:succinate-semialdehyde dehydrogenase [Fusarium tjaetaba]KAF5625323.1 succinate-semialdehyde dehydrogenase [Fusarium tjaetaba]